MRHVWRRYEISKHGIQGKNSTIEEAVQTTNLKFIFE